MFWPLTKKWTWETVLDPVKGPACTERLTSAGAIDCEAVAVMLLIHGGPVSCPWAGEATARKSSAQARPAQARKDMAISPTWTNHARSRASRARDACTPCRRQHDTGSPWGC